MERRKELDYPLGTIPAEAGPPPAPTAAPSAASNGASPAAEPPRGCLLVELGTEEMPPADVDSAAEQLEYGGV